ncbi:MAG TPA: hypothetical protein VFA18_20970, partial [Gemmataceae bacterium]|nr:hypothetical protein [Gemmataceae bacterium]
MIAAATRVAGQWLRHRLLPSTFTALRFVAGSRWSAGARPLWQAFALAVLIAAAGLLLKPDLFADPTSPPGAADGHATLSLELAIHRVLWGLPSHYYVGPNAAATPRTQLTKPGSLSRPVLSLSPTVGEAPAIAASHLKPIRHNENALMLLDTALLRFWPQLTVSGLIRAHTVLKIACLAVFLLFLLRVGASLLMSFALFQGALTLVAWINTTHPLSLYPFVLPVTLLLTACLGLVLSLGLHRRLTTAGLALVLVGGLVAFLANLRTTYLLVGLALTLCAGIVAWFDLWRLPAMTRRRLTAAV